MENRKQTENRRIEGRKKKKSSLLSKLITSVMVLVMLTGIGFLLYPTLSEKWNALHQSYAIAGYAEQVENNDFEKIQDMWEQARAYNASLLSKQNRFVLSDEETNEYNSILDVTDTGIMGYVVIPKISVKLPIYHGTDEAILQIAIGHIPGTSLPVGGESSHAVISGHRGLPSAKLFTRLDEMVEGDLFELHVLDKVLRYQVDQITVVLPEELEHIEIEEGKDYCTLVTCTPYSVNTHRLLVRGQRVEGEFAPMPVPENTEQPKSTENARQGGEIPEWMPLAFAGFAMAVLLFALFVPVKKKGKKNH